MEAGRRPGPHQVQLLRRLGRPRRQHVGPAGGEAGAMTGLRPGAGAGTAVVDDESAFAALAERHRRELHVHCYRMLASFDEAEDAVQETMLRAWRGREGFDGDSLFRAWLYRIATNVCLDVLRRRSRRLTAVRSLAEVP